MAAIPVTAEIARRATALAWRDLPDDLVERTRQCLLDWFAVTARTKSGTIRSADQSPPPMMLPPRAFAISTPLPRSASVAR